MKIFISSLISGYEAYRKAVADAAETLGHKIIRAEDFPATAGTPQQACLSAVRQSDLVVLLIGGRYGYVQPSGLSATHEEYREARERRPVLVFVESDVQREVAQQGFLDEVEAWVTGHFRASFSSPAELAERVLRAVHDHELATATGAVDEAEMLARATQTLADQDLRHSAEPRLAFAVAGGPYQQILRPVEIEDTNLARDVQREALFGEFPVLDASKGTEIAIRDGLLTFNQPKAVVVLDEAGSIYVAQPGRRPTDHTGLPVIIEEDVTADLGRAVRFAGWLLDRIDQVHRLTDVVPVAHLSGAGYLSWRTRAEHAASPNMAQFNTSPDIRPVTLKPSRRHRRALTHDASRITEDLVALLRRRAR
jgi:hypothetical protein